MSRAQVWLPLEKIPPVVVDAVLAAEDRRFYPHPGIHARAVRPPVASRSLIEFLGDLARALGRDLGATGLPEVWDAIGALPGPYQGIDAKAWEAIGPLGLMPERK